MIVKLTYHYYNNNKLFFKTVKMMKNSYQGIPLKIMYLSLMKMLLRKMKVT